MRSRRLAGNMVELQEEEEEEEEMVGRIGARGEQ